MEQPNLFVFNNNLPLIVPRPEHCVSRKDMDREALKVLYRLKDHGFLAYLVGGSVRDLLLGRRPKDFDIGTNATPRQVRRLFRYSRIIGRRFRLVHVYFKGGKIIEVSTFRRQVDYDDREAARMGLSESEIYGTPREDAFRRDLTINGLFYNIADFSVIDFVGGMNDLRNGLIRTIGDPAVRFVRDPVRMMRAVRHAARTGFSIEPKTWEAINENRSLIRLCSIHRVRDEWLKDLSSGRSSQWAELAFKTGLLQEIFPGYWRGLDRESAQQVRRFMVGLLGRLDGLISEGKELSEPFLLSLLVMPRLFLSDKWRALESNRIKWPTHEVRQLLKDFLHPFDFRRAVQDAAAQILASQWPIALCYARGSWPKRVVNKSTFEEALLLFNMVREVKWGEEAVFVQTSPKESPPRRKKRKKKRRTREKDRDEVASKRSGIGAVEC